MKKEFRDFESAREFARALKLKSRDEWEKYCKSNTLPTNSSSRPDYIYKKEWKGWGDFLGTGNIQLQQKKFRSFNEAREFVRSLGLKGTTEWYEYCKSNTVPNDIPRSPEHVYKNKGWESMGDFLGTGTVAPQFKVFRPFKEAREFVRSLNLKGQKDWIEYCKSGNKPDDIPNAPGQVYKNNEWEGWRDFAGNDFRPFQEAREFARKLGLKTALEWKDYCKSGNKPDDIPANPWDFYKEWKKK